MKLTKIEIQFSKEGLQDIVDTISRAVPGDAKWPLFAISRDGGFQAKLTDSTLEITDTGK